MRWALHSYLPLSKAAKVIRQRAKTLTPKLPHRYATVSVGVVFLQALLFGAALCTSRPLSEHSCSLDMNIYNLLKKHTLAFL